MIGKDDYGKLLRLNEWDLGIVAKRLSYDRVESLSESVLKYV